MGWAKLEAVVKPLSDTIMDKLKYVSMPDHSGKIGYQHAVSCCRHRHVVAHRGWGKGWADRSVSKSAEAAHGHTPCPSLAPHKQVIKDLQHLQDELTQPWGWHRTLRGVFSCVMCPLWAAWRVLCYLACCACCTTAPQRSAQRALDKEPDVERPESGLSRAIPDQRRQLQPPKLVVFIDDLDRVPPLKVAEIIAAINLVLAARRASLRA